jgi:hypothetical protein
LKVSHSIITLKLSKRLKRAFKTLRAKGEKMKARTTNCIECRKAVYKEAETAYIKEQYRYFSDSAYSMAVFAVCGVLTAMVRRGRTKQYIQQLYKDMCFVFATPEMFGKQITMTDIMHSFEEEYGIDWKKLEVHIESEKHYLTGVRKAVKANEQ